MRDDFRRLAHAGITFNAPLSEERASAFVAALPISPGHHVLDLGCGWGELLLRILAAHPATTGTGVDTAKEALDRGVLTAARRGLLGRVEFIEAPAETFVDVADIVVCVGQLACLRRFVGRARMASAMRHTRRAPALRRRLLGLRSEPGDARIDRCAATPRRASRGGQGAAISDRAAQRSRARRSGTRSRRPGARASSAPATRRRSRSRPSGSASTRMAIERRSASPGSCWPRCDPGVSRLSGTPGSGYATRSTGSFAATTFWPSRS